jgi:hypothetical protein
MLVQFVRRTTTHAGGLALSPFAIASITYAQFPWTEAGMEATF